MWFALGGDASLVVGVVMVRVVTKMAYAVDTSIPQQPNYNTGHSR